MKERRPSPLHAKLVSLVADGNQAAALPVVVLHHGDRLAPKLRIPSLLQGLRTPESLDSNKKTRSKDGTNAARRNARDVGVGMCAYGRAGGRRSCVGWGGGGLAGRGRRREDSRARERSAAPPSQIACSTGNEILYSRPLRAGEPFSISTVCGRVEVGRRINSWGASTALFRRQRRRGRRGGGRAHRLAT
jgi:hypothetical protein